MSRLLDGFRGLGVGHSRVTERGVPDSGVICMILTSIALLLAVGGAGVGPEQAVLAWGAGVWDLLELAMLDAVSRVAADIVKLSFLRGRPRWTRSRIYFALLWSLIAFGVGVLAVGFDQPLVLLVLSAALNGVVMFLYSGLLLWLNLRTFRGPLRPHPVRVVALLGAFGFFGYFSALTLADRLAGAH